ncbi:MAG: DUF3524 domain-containing protein [Marinicella sp.]|nr:DUF3524 domain-containing protein [Xanthomonadales bacterium]
MSPKNILLLSAYDAASHHYWHHQLEAMFPQHHWQILALKDRYFSWRMGASALNFQADFHSQLLQSYDLLIATSMTDLASLRSFYPHLASIPNLLYFHENQFAYPENQQQKGLLEIQLKNILSAVSADQLAFNSNFNRMTFLSGVQTFLKQMPDGVPVNLLKELQNKSTVIPVPIKPDCQPKTAPNQPKSKTLQVVWNHRWEHDKGPETLLELLKLCQENEQIKFHIIGQQFRNTPAAMQEILSNHQHQCLNLGHLESRTQYIKTLQSADVVLSTAHHDFQGIAMLEAVACGCRPIAPNRVVYPELYPPQNLYPSHPSNPKQEAAYIYKLLLQAKQLATPKIDIERDVLLAKYATWIS